MDDPPRPYITKCERCGQFHLAAVTCGQDIADADEAKAERRYGSHVEMAHVVHDAAQIAAAHARLERALALLAKSEQRGS